ncbi:MAG TPA: hypothetical protein VFJ01_05530 [Oleiagrimonas sp.]|nr:hypothetical protein [Oleiagrimonas sp.]
MNSTEIRTRITRAERMLKAAREEHTRNHAEDTQEFLRAAVRNLNQAIQMLEADGKVVELGRSAKGRMS